MLSGANLLKGTDQEIVHVHQTTNAYSSEGEIDLTDALMAEDKICDQPVFVSIVEADGSVTGELITGLSVDSTGKKLVGDIPGGKSVFVDYYILKKSSSVAEIQIDAEHFGGYFYVEASTLWREQATGKDVPAEITLPNVKIQSNFTFSMASTGDPSTFSFVMDR